MEINETLKQENTALRGVIDQLGAERYALELTVNDVMRANINLKSGAYLLEKKISTLQNDLALKDATNQDRTFPDLVPTVPGRKKREVK